MFGNTKMLAMVLSLAVGWPALAEEPGQWANVQSLRRGDRIGVVQSDQKRIEGRFESATGSEIALRTDRDISIAKDSVIRMYRRPRLTRAKRTPIGAAIGVAVGAIVAAGIGSNSNDEGFFGGPMGGIAGGAAVAAGGGIGAAVGAIRGSGYKTIYQRPAPP